MPLPPCARSPKHWAPILIAMTLTAGAAGQERLVERTVAIVGRTVIMLSDVRLALALGLVDPAGGDPERVAIERLIERSLVLQEVSRFAPPEPAQDAIDARLAQVTARAGSPARLAAVLEGAGVTASHLTGWIRDDLRIAAYLDQRFATAGVPSEPEVADYARAHAADLQAAGVDEANVSTVARERLQAERRRELIADWLAELRRRTTVMEMGR